MSMMERKNHRTIAGDAPIEMSETHLEVLRSHGFQFGAKTGSRFIAAVHEIVDIVAKEQIDDLHQKVLALQFDVNDINGRLVDANEKKDNLAKKLAVIESDFLKAVSEVEALKEKLAASDRRIQRMQAHLDAQRKHFDANPNDMHAKERLEALEGMVMAADEEPKEATSEIVDTCATPDPVPASPETPVSDHGNTEK